jgi:hypothetical protein
MRQVRHDETERSQGIPCSVFLPLTHPSTSRMAEIPRIPVVPISAALSRRALLATSRMVVTGGFSELVGVRVTSVFSPSKAQRVALLLAFVARVARGGTRAELTRPLRKFGFVHSSETREENERGKLVAHACQPVPRVPDGGDVARVGTGCFVSIFEV